MIVGRGLLATAFASFEHDPAMTIFASGVSNSQEARESEYARERALLEDTLQRDSRLVYFSSCGVVEDATSLTRYMRHKLAMEALVGARPGNLVLRLPQVVGRTDNPHTLTNFLRDRIVSGQAFAIWGRAERNLVDIDDIVSIATSLLVDAAADTPALAAIGAERSLPMPELVSIFERVLGARANCVVEPEGSPMQVVPRLPARLTRALGIDLGEGYAERVLRKYYGAAVGG